MKLYEHDPPRPSMPKPWNPGSTMARLYGCTCPVGQNNHGKGCQKEEGAAPLFFISINCPLHWGPEEGSQEDARV